VSRCPISYEQYFADVFIREMKLELLDKVCKASFIKMRKEHNKHIRRKRTQGYIQICPLIAKLDLAHRGLLPCLLLLQWILVP